MTIVLFIGGLVTLIAGAEFLVRGASDIAIKMKISPLVVGLTIVAFGTSAPELFISIKSALQGSPDIAVGNVIGSNICNVALILGIGALIVPIGVKRSTLWVNWPIAMLASVVLLIDIRDQTIDMWEGILFITGISFYNVYLIRNSRKEVKAQEARNNVEKVPINIPLLGRDIVFMIIGGVGLVYGSEWMVTGAITIAKEFGISERIIGISVVAFGTSLPELATTVVAALKSKTDLGLGNLIGSNIFNILSILGITAVITPIHVNEQIAHFDIYWMLGITAILFPVMYTRMNISRLEGFILLALYGGYMYLVLFN